LQLCRKKIGGMVVRLAEFPPSNISVKMLKANIYSLA